MASISVVSEISTALAKGFIAMDEFFVAVGTGDPEWGQEFDDEYTFSSNLITLDHQNVEDVVVENQAQTVTYVEDTDYTVNYVTGVLTRIGGGSISNDATVHVTYEFSRNVQLTETDLDDEIGRKRASFVGFVESDNDGEILTDGGSWTLSEDPTPHVLIQATFLVDEAEDSTIREFGVFVNTEVDGGVPEGQNYIEPADIVDKGFLCMKQKTAPLVKNDIGELSRNFVITL